MFYVYIIESEFDSSFYIGFTSDLGNRLQKHNSARTGYTRRKQPWVLKYFEEFDHKKDAIKREKKLKRQKSKEFYRKLINNWPGSSIG